MLLLYFVTRAYLFSPDEGSRYVFRPETIVASFLHLTVLFYQEIVLQHASLWFSSVVPLKEVSSFDRPGCSGLMPAL